MIHIDVIKVPIKYSGRENGVTRSRAFLYKFMCPSAYCSCTLLGPSLFQNLKNDFTRLWTKGNLRPSQASSILKRQYNLKMMPFTLCKSDLLNTHRRCSKHGGKPVLHQEQTALVLSDFQMGRTLHSSSSSQPDLGLLSPKLMTAHATDLRRPEIKVQVWSGLGRCAEASLVLLRVPFVDFRWEQISETCFPYSTPDESKRYI